MKYDSESHRFKFNKILSRVVPCHSSIVVYFVDVKCIKHLFWPVAIEWTSIRYCSIFLMLHISCEKDKHVPSTSHCLGRSSWWFKILKLQKSARKENMMPIWSSMYTYERSSMWCHSSEAPQEHHWECWGGQIWNLSSMIFTKFGCCKDHSQANAESRAEKNVLIEMKLLNWFV